MGYRSIQHNIEDEFQTRLVLAMTHYAIKYDEHGKKYKKILTERIEEIANDLCISPYRGRELAKGIGYDPYK